MDNREESTQKIIKWTNRRWMSWLCLITIICVVFSMLFLVDESRIEKLSDVVTWLFMTLGSIVGTYFGVTTYIDRK